jgi:hypothetical protein
VALTHGVNAHWIRRWLAERGVEPPSRRALPVPDPGFVPIPLEPTHPAPPAETRAELRRGATAVAITWPVSAADACGAWLREWLR